MTQERDEKYVRMTTTPVERLVSSFALPSILTMLIGSIYNMVDTFFVGQLDTQSTAALGIVFSYMGIIQAVGFFFGHGSGNFISRALGGRHEEEAEAMASTGFCTAVAMATVIALLGALFMEPLLHAFGATDTVMAPAKDYFRFILLGTPFIVGSLVLNNQMRLQGNAAVAVRGIMSGAVLNVILDPIFIFALHMGVAGAGLATALSQMVSFVLLLCLCGRYGGISVKLRSVRPSRHAYREIAAGGSPSLVRQGLMCLSTICLNHCAGIYGDAALAAFSIVGRVMQMAGSCMIGFGQGFQPVCGYNYGAGLFSRVRRAFRFALIVAFIYSLVLTAVGLLFAPQVVAAFRGDDAEVVRIGAMALRAHCITFPLTSFIVLTNMFLQNIRRTGPAMVAAAARHGLFFIPALIVGTAVWGLQGVVAAQPVSDICALLLCLPLCRVAMKELR